MAWLIPREHGAYGQLAFPMAAALIAGGSTTAVWLLIVTFVAAFFAHEPLLVLLGQRGARASRELRPDAVRSLALSGGIAIAGAVAGWFLMGPAHRWTMVVPAAFALATVPLIIQKTQKTLTGELHVALTLASCALPVGAAAGLRPQEGAACWFVMTLGFWAATFAVHATIANQRREPSRALRAGAIAVAAGSPLVGVLIADRFRLHPQLWISTMPLSLLGAIVGILLPSARHLRRVGWALIAGSAAAGALLVWSIRAS